MNWWKILKEDHWEGDDPDDYYWKMWIEAYNKGGF